MFLSIEYLDNFSLKLLFRVQMTKNDLTIQLSLNNNNYNNKKK